MANLLSRFTLDDDEVELSTNDNAISTYTQQMRLAAINEFTKGGLPTHATDVNVLLKALADMDRTAAMNKRLEIERADGDTNRDVLEIVRRMHERNAHGMASTEEVRSSIPSIDVSMLPDTTHDAGHMAFGIVLDTSKDFIKRMGADKSED